MYDSDTIAQAKSVMKKLEDWTDDEVDSFLGLILLHFEGPDGVSNLARVLAHVGSVADAELFPRLKTEATEIATGERTFLASQVTKLREALCTNGVPRSGVVTGAGVATGTGTTLLLDSIASVLGLFGAFGGAIIGAVATKIIRIGLERFCAGGFDD